MLAEELAQYARRAAWNDRIGTLEGGFGEQAVAARVWCRLAALHRDPDYTSSAVIVGPAAYLDDAERMVRSAAGALRDHPSWAADFGLALLDCFALIARPN